MQELDLSGSVIWAGPSDDLAAMRSALDVLCLPSAVDRIPNVLADAMALWVPCVATDAVDCRALVGDLGWIVPSGYEDALEVVLGGENFSVDAMPEKTRCLLSSLPR